MNELYIFNWTIFTLKHNSFKVNIPSCIVMISMHLHVCVIIKRLRFMTLWCVYIYRVESVVSTAANRDAIKIDWHQQKLFLYECFIIARLMSRGTAHIVVRIVNHFQILDICLLDNHVHCEERVFSFLFVSEWCGVRWWGRINVCQS